MSEEPIKIVIHRNWADRFDTAAAIAEQISNRLLRVAVALEKIAEYERQKLL